MNMTTSNEQKCLRKRKKINHGLCKTLTPALSHNLKVLKDPTENNCPSDDQATEVIGNSCADDA